MRSTRIEVAASRIQNFTKYTSALDLDGSDYGKLKLLAEQINGMGEPSEWLFYGALDAESINGLDDILRIAGHLEDYEIIEGVTCDRNLGVYLVENNMLDVTFSKEVQPYLDYVAIGAEYYSSHGGAYTMNGYVKRIEKEPELAENKEAVLTLHLASHCRAKRAELRLPATEENFEAVRRKLQVYSLDSAEITGLSSSVPGLAEALPLEFASVSDAIKLAEAIEEIRQSRTDMNTLLAALEVETPDTFSRALGIALDLDDYELVDNSEYDYGRDALEELGADMELIDKIENHLDIDRFGADAMREDGVRKTRYGLVKRLIEPFPEPEQGQAMM